MELIIIFVLLPVSLSLSLPIYVKLGAVLLAVSYVLIVVAKTAMHAYGTAVLSNGLDEPSTESLFSRPFRKGGVSFPFMVLKRVLVLFSVFALISTLFVAIYLPSKLFIVVSQAPMMWIAIIFVYVLLSVLPQEGLYRVFFFRRYRSLFFGEQHVNKTKRLFAKENVIFVTVNALLFSLAHLFFFNIIVLLLTFCGGVLFASTYLQSYKYRSAYLIICIEHACYGLWLFTVGLGEMLAFPMPSD
ncbi:hypothetical protein ISG33_04980 [Glaciecola sp. MH2013]|uniref:CPBP family glutamic-type intramembrane protease n=1 Tax=Glaciecola sp. MH2013 TaxID=2785524 RepID=UPI00189D435A|nr:CPBP family glutamic-type intramembrane protease [Glaciecola sp. MH2013]MBF7072753.1 hypothetical protein [Glaciecola sp. MH2013]